MLSKNKKQRRYLRKIYQWIALAMLLPLISFAVIAFVNVEKAVLDNEYQANKKILYQVKYNINFMDDMIVNSVLSMYYNPEISPLIFNKDVDFTELLNEMIKIKSSIVSVNPFIHSIYLYNSHTKTYFTTLEDLLFKDINFEALLHSKQELPKLKAIPRKIEYNIEKDKKRYENVVTYLMYDFKGEFNQPEGALIVNASTEWLLNSIKQINMVDENRENQIMILDDSGGIVGQDSEEKGNLQDSLKTIYQQHHSEQASTDNTGYFTEEINGKKYLITYTFVDKMNWTLVKAQLYDEVFQKINALKLTLIVIIVAFMILAFIASIFISRKIYKPIDNLVKHVVSNVSEMDQSHAKDEISYLNKAYQLSFDQLNQYKLNKQSDREIMKTYFLRKLLVDSQSVTKNEFIKAESESGIELKQEEPGLVCIVKIDNRTQFEGMFNPFDRDLCTFGIINISLELFSQFYRIEVVEMKNDHMAFILNIDGSDKEKLFSEITTIWSKAQSYINQYFKVSISIFISDHCENLQDLSGKYDVALNNSVYRLIFGKSCILTNSIIQANTDNSQVGYSAYMEKKLVDSLKSGIVLSTEETLKKLFDEIAQLNYNNVLLSIMSLINTLKQVTEEINRSRLEPLLINFNLLSNQLFSMETLDEQYGNILQICRSIVSKAERTESDKHSIINNTVIELIQADYANQALCLQYISDKLNVSAKQISKIFNQQYARSVADYINDVRLEKAAEWFGNSNHSIREVLQKIGVENESYFYKLFKKKYGVTPKEYIITKHVQGTRDTN